MAAMVLCVAACSPAAQQAANTAADTESSAAAENSAEPVEGELMALSETPLPASEGENIDDASARIISVYEINGGATVTREKKGDIEAFADMKLQNGDKLAVASGGTLTLRLDEDKFVTLDEETSIELNATGTDRSSQTDIKLISGTVLSNITAKLGDDSVYDVSTPKSTMSVRGTVFSVSYIPGENDEGTVTVSVFDGAVNVQPLTSDGSKTEESALITTGQSAVVTENVQKGVIASSNEPLDVQKLPPAIVDTVIKIAQDRPDTIKNEIADNLNKFKENDYQAEPTPAPTAAPTTVAQNGGGNTRTGIVSTPAPAAEPTPAPVAEPTHAPAPAASTPTPMSSPSSEPTPSASPSPAPSATATPSSEPKPKPTPTTTPIPSPTATPIPSSTPTATVTPTPTPTALPSPTPTAMPEPNPGPVPTFVPDPVPTATPVPTPVPVMAYVNGVPYASLSDAINAANSGGAATAISVVRNAMLSGSIYIGSNVSLDMQSNMLVVSPNCSINLQGSLNIKHSLRGGLDMGEGSEINVKSGAALKMEGIPLISNDSLVSTFTLSSGAQITLTDNKMMLYGHINLNNGKTFDYFALNNSFNPIMTIMGGSSLDVGGLLIIGSELDIYPGGSISASNGGQISPADGSSLYLGNGCTISTLGNIEGFDTSNFGPVIVAEGGNVVPGRYIFNMSQSMWKLQG